MRVADIAPETIGVQLMAVSDKILMRKRALIEAINDELKNMAQIEHSRYRFRCRLHRQPYGWSGSILVLPEETDDQRGACLAL